MKRWKPIPPRRSPSKHEVIRFKDENIRVWISFHGFSKRVLVRKVHFYRGLCILGPFFDPSARLTSNYNEVRLNQCPILSGKYKCRAMQHITNG